MARPAGCSVQKARARQEVERALAALDRPTVLVHPGLLARYGLLALLQPFQERTRRGAGRRGARAGRCDAARDAIVVDDVPLPVVHASDWARVQAPGGSGAYGELPTYTRRSFPSCPTTHAPGDLELLPWGVSDARPRGRGGPRAGPARLAGMRARRQYAPAQEALAAVWLAGENPKHGMSPSSPVRDTGSRWRRAPQAFTLGVPGLARRRSRNQSNERLLILGVWAQPSADLRRGDSRGDSGTHRCSARALR